MLCRGYARCSYSVWKTLGTSLFKQETLCRARKVFISSVKIPTLGDIKLFGLCQSKGWCSESCANAEEDEVPVSLLGDGLSRSIRIQRRLLRKRNNTTEEQKDLVYEELPVALHLLLKDTPEDFNKLYPDLQITAHDQTMPLFPEQQEERQPQYPFSKFVHGTQSLDLETPPDSESQTTDVEKSKSIEILAEVYAEAAKSIRDEEMLEEAASLREELWQANYGTPDAMVPSSDVPCGGCGAVLHCRDSSIPGYMPSEKFKTMSVRALRSEICQRCLYMQHFNVALKISVDPNEYPRIISEIKNRIALVIFLVDLTDFPCSTWPGMVEMIGPKCPIFVVGNKVDLLPRDTRGYLENVKACLHSTLRDVGIDTGKNVKHIALISAKTGYGVEELITSLHKIWGCKGDVFLVGCTNVGKSTLFNALLQSDLCKVQAVDLIQRATTSVWPGTTLNLLKFPILRPSGWRVYLRALRLNSARHEVAQEQKLRRMMYSKSREPHYATLIGRIGKTFHSSKTPVMEEADMFKIYPREPVKQVTFDPSDPVFAEGHFCYDTPGAVYKDQVLDLLTTEELMLVLPKEIIVPRTFLLRSNQTLFLAGLGRVDLLQVDSPNIRITVFASSQLPVHIVYTFQADRFYSIHSGTSMLAVPTGGPQRLKDFPPLKPRDVEIVGEDHSRSTADIVLSSGGWVSLTVPKDKLCKLTAYTPDGRGCHVRKPALLPEAVNLRGRRIKGTPAYENTKVSIL